MPPKADAAKAAEAAAANAAATTSVNGAITKLQQDIAAAFAAKQTQVNNARAELATLVTRGSIDPAAAFPRVRAPARPATS